MISDLAHGMYNIEERYTPFPLKYERGQLATGKTSTNTPTRNAMSRRIFCACLALLAQLDCLHWIVALVAQRSIIKYPKESISV